MPRIISGPAAPPGSNELDPVVMSSFEYSAEVAGLPRPTGSPSAAARVVNGRNRVPVCILLICRNNHERLK
jgi:hypothetical protein